VSSASGSLSYRELNRKTNQLAHALRQRNVGPGVWRRSPQALGETIVAIVGTLKSGLPTPLDPTIPLRACVNLDNAVASDHHNFGSRSLVGENRPR
jgi:non-ribosomal peptide synthetase component F